MHKRTTPKVFIRAKELVRNMTPTETDGYTYHQNDHNHIDYDILGTNP